jgi:di/tricarboxylate transporter
MILIYAILNLGDLLGSQLTNIVLLFSNEVVVMISVEFILILIILYSVFVVKEPKNVLNTKISLDLLKQTLGVIFKKRPNKCSLLLLLTLICGFINRLAFSEEKSLIGTYAKLPPFKWTTRQYSIYKTIRPVIRK